MKKNTDYQLDIRGKLRQGGKCFFAALICLLLPVIGNTAPSAEHELQIEFSFDVNVIDGKEIDEYHLYREGELIPCPIPFDPSSISPDGLSKQHINCTVVLETGYFAFTLIAVYTDGFQSPHSAPFSLYIHDGTSAIRGLLTLSGQSPSDISGLGSVAGGSTVVDLADVIHLLRLEAQ